MLSQCHVNKNVTQYPTSQSSARKRLCISRSPLDDPKKAAGLFPFFFPPTVEPLEWNRLAILRANQAALPSHRSPSRASEFAARSQDHLRTPCARDRALAGRIQMGLGVDRVKKLTVWSREDIQCRRKAPSQTHEQNNNNKNLRSHPLPLPPLGGGEQHLHNRFNLW